jgi:epoxyqueuosine reductase
MNPNTRKKELTQFIRDKALSEGFLYCGFSSATFLESEANRLENWLLEQKHGEMAYMENHFDKRLDPRLLHSGTKTIISLLYNYFPSKQYTAGFTSPKISKYAWGEDYHQVVKDKLWEIFNSIKSVIGDVSGRVFVDSAPVLEKEWARRSGAGWLGKNGNIIRPRTGSFFFLAEIFLDITLEYDGPMKDFCGSCTRCIDACPTDALQVPYTVDASKCISYATIELKNKIIPSTFSGKMDNWLFGCDICQDVCPWNRFSVVHTEERFLPTADWTNWVTSDWELLTEEMFSKLFKKSAVKRAKFDGLKRNIDFLSSQKNEGASS